MEKCKQCGREYTYSRKAGHQKTICNSCVTLKRRIEIKEQCVEYLGGKCSVCGYNKCIEALDFHHKNPKEKEFGISGSHCRKFENIRKEVEKCILLCANCHRELHSK